ncbi:PQQ-dependent sugar dehydrogenase [Sphingomonas sp.]|uniref:PQQ-dependent sugar dehydrogenase n=1 Tax=Sphingomonas sp. TaxID=28214 RepID=UPI000DB10842|nr:PQQ-dependent sugar dehydrogenase [Sphingomonas sp.]PZU06880.1 MAG: glucose sorbosone dehydrogenase [Sphingomonas sp.]
MRAGRAIVLAALFAAGAAGLLADVRAQRNGMPPGDVADLAGFGERTFASVCAGCHGTDLSGGRGPSLFDARLLGARSDQQLHDRIAAGVTGTEMPAFGNAYSGSQIDGIIAYLRRHTTEIGQAPAPRADPAGQVIHSRRQAFRIDVVTDALETPWGLAFLPDGRLLVTERPGRLRIIDRRGKLLPEPVRNLPKVWERQDAGMLDVAIHPRFARNGLIYLSYVEMAPGHVLTREEARPPLPGEHPGSPPSMTVLIRGRINARNEWVTDREIFRAPTALYTASGSHYGTRFLFDGKGHLFFSLGDRGDMANAQRLDTPLGKIHRVNEDGSVPGDNPFVHVPGAVPSIWSYGHRNPEGLAFDPATGLLWESEHGPAGGDEINIIEKGHNYGWGVVSMGMQPGIVKREAPGMDQPIAYYTPTIAPSGIHFYRGTRYPGWTGNLFVAGLAGQQLRRLAVRGRAVMEQEEIFSRFGRVRAIATGPDGLLYLLLQTATGPGTGVDLTSSTPGSLVRLVPLP